MAVITAESNRRLFGEFHVERAARLTAGITILLLG
jgi:hypothetical protein